MKNLKNLNGAKALSKNEQKSINGGGFGDTGLPNFDTPDICRYSKLHCDCLQKGRRWNYMGFCEDFGPFIQGPDGQVLLP